MQDWQETYFNECLEATKEWAPGLSQEDLLKQHNELEHILNHGDGPSSQAEAIDCKAQLTVLKQIATANGWL